MYGNFRLSRILGREKGVIIVAMDHGNFAGPMVGIVSIGETIRRIINEKFNAIILCPGMAKLYADLIGTHGKSLILRVDGARTIYGKGVTRQITEIEDALRIGADAVIAMGYIGGEEEGESLETLSEIALSCREWNVPLLAEMLPAPEIQNKYDLEYIKVAARVGAELGADMIKTYYTGSIETFRKVVEGCPVPIVIAGGPRMDNERKVLEMVEGAIKAGAVGVAFGRNIWQHKNPSGMIRAIGRIVYENATVDEALNELNLNR
ncbi:MAG: 2-amino-3,7-dideoxy-D-threo-hept-6-ulosonate synthase [archaeon GB-1867-035]|nr:2-amino-3,7-dideoxy-D-threo-hept-6-ulosonate synthase [Candidatus Culexmicrobium profundum]